MNIDDIVSRVRKAIDEEAVDNASFTNASAGDSAKMDNIIKASIGTALHWVCLNASTELLNGSDETTSGSTPTPIDTGIMHDVDFSNNDIEEIADHNAGRVSLGADFIRLARVRVTGWHRAIKVPILEDSEEYLQLYDTNGATATADRPQAALIEKSIKQIEVWPCAKTTDHVYVTYVSYVEPKGLNSSGTEPSDPAQITKYALPPRAIGSIIYYIAFLVLSAYGDARAARMLEIAMMNIGQKP